MSIQGFARQLLDGDRVAWHALVPRVRKSLAGMLAWPDTLSAIIFLLIYVGLEWVSFIHEHKGVPVTPWNPGLGVAFTLMVLKGPAYGVLLFAGVVIAEIFVLRTEIAWPIVPIIGALVAASYATAAAAARRQLRLDVSLSRLRDVSILLAAGIMGAAGLTVLLTALLLFTGELDANDITQASIPLFVGDVIGIAVMTPLLLRLSEAWKDISGPMLIRLAPEMALYLLVGGFALWMILDSSGSEGYKFFYLLFLPVVAAAARHGIDGSCLALAGTQLGLVGLLHLYGYDAAAFTEFQALMFVLTLTGLLVGVLVSERRGADAAARQAEARLKEMQAEAARAARMNMVSGMASALAHEINQPMTAARALARSAQQLLKAREPDLERAGTNLASLVAQIDHAGGVIRRMREFLRRGQPHFSTVDIRAVLDDALVLARPEAAAHRTAISLDVAEALPLVFGDRIQLQQVVLNLIHNGVDAISEAHRTDGQIEVRAYLSDRDGDLEISVLDNGVGVPASGPLFEPLTSSKKQGLGLGLSICASIVHAHGGRIWLESSAAGATEFRFSLPARAPGTA